MFGSSGEGGMRPNRVCTCRVLRAVSRIRVCRDTAILLGRCEERDGLIEQQKRYAPVQGSCAGGKRS